MPTILLATINARYIHASLGLRWLKANLGELEAVAELCEFGLGQRPGEIAEAILARRPRIVGLGVYVWNVEASREVAAILKAVAPDTVLVLGGPEVSYPPDLPPVAELADYLVCGGGEISFRRLCESILTGEPPGERILPQEPADLAALALPYRLYSDDDLAHRLVYVEASRGCPFKCSFCLSALDRTATPFPIEPFLAAMQELLDRGARRFKFIDRTFNLRIDHSCRILEFFLDRLVEGLFLHFEVVPDHLPPPLRDLIARFPPGVLQFEIGIQTFDPEIQTLIQRHQHRERTLANLAWLRGESHAHLHTDLILGLPGQTLAGIAADFDRLVALLPQEIQVGILKRLRGTPLCSLSPLYGMVYNPTAPYEVLQTAALDFATLRRLGRFARYWELYGNSGKFPHGLGLLLGSSPFANFLAFADWLWQTSGNTRSFSLEALFDHLYRWLSQGMGEEKPLQALAADYRDSGARGAPAFLRAHPTLRSSP